MKKLIAYFSATGTTEDLAKRLSELSNYDLFEIEPETPYTASDLDWTNKSSRSSLEMEDKNSRPKIKNKIENIDEYDTIFVGFPIWWYIAPTIINTFLEQYNLTGKTIVPFATSGGSNMGKTNDYLKSSCPGAKLVDGKRLGTNSSDKELKDWIEKY